MAVKKVTNLAEGIGVVMHDPKLRIKYPRGINPLEMFDELIEHKLDFPLISTIDIANEMTKLYGRPPR